MLSNHDMLQEMGRDDKQFSYCIFNLLLLVVFVIYCGFLLIVLLFIIKLVINILF